MTSKRGLVAAALLAASCQSGGGAGGGDPTSTAGADVEAPQPDRSKGIFVLPINEDLNGDGIFNDVYQVDFDQCGKKKDSCSYHVFLSSKEGRVTDAGVVRGRSVFAIRDTLKPGAVADLGVFATNRCRGGKGRIETYKLQNGKYAKVSTSAVCQEQPFDLGFPQSLQISTAGVDLDGDGKDETTVTDFCGATGNCSTLLYLSHKRENPNAKRIFGGDVSGLGFDKLATSHNGVADIRLFNKGGCVGLEMSIDTMEFNGTEYVSNGKAISCGCPVDMGGDEEPKDRPPICDGERTTPARNPANADGSDTEPAAGD